MEIRHHVTRHLETFSLRIRRNSVNSASDIKKNAITIVLSNHDFL